MSQFSVYPRLGDRGYVVNVQSDLVVVRTTQVVIPLIPREVAPPALVTYLNPILLFQGDHYVLLTQGIASIRLAQLARPVGTLAPQRDVIVRAIDALLGGI